MGEENNESKVTAEAPFDENSSSSMSLDDRKDQLENKINKEMNADNNPAPQAEITSKPDSTDKQTAFKSPYDRPQPARVNNNPNSAAALPKRNDNPQNRGSSYDVYKNYNGYNNYNNNYYNGYYNRPTYQNGSQHISQNNAAVNDYKPYSPYSGQTPKEKMNSAVKSYIILILSIIVIFLLGFIFECVRTYNDNGIFGGENGIFSGDFDKYFDTDYDFGFKFNKGDSDEDDSDKSTDSDDVFDYIDKDSSDSDVIVRRDAPDESLVVDKSAANLKAADQPEDIDSADYTAKKAFKRVENSVVNVVVYNGEIGNEEDATGSGSGIIISEDGYIVTNSHVIGDSKKYGVEIITTSGDSYVAAIVGYDARTDLAVLKIDDTNLTAAEFVNSDQIEVGQDAIAVGNPGGVAYSNSLTRGCVSALNRTVSTNKMVTYIQTDAAINPGNSGGPLLNSAGQVMGITTIKIANSDYEGMGFAIPSNTVISIANDLIGQGFVSHRVRLGITGTEAAMNYLNGAPAGIIINEFSDDSPFTGTEAQVGDIITAIDGNTIETFSELFSVLNDYNPGDKATITLYRSASGITAEKTFDVEIELLADNGETQR